MKFLADVNVPRPLITRLLAEGHEVLSVIDIDRRLKDPSLLRLALAECALILTNDKDYKRHVLEESYQRMGLCGYASQRFHAPCVLTTQCRLFASIRTVSCINLLPSTLTA